MNTNPERLGNILWAVGLIILPLIAFGANHLAEGSGTSIQSHYGYSSAAAIPELERIFHENLEEDPAPERLWLPDWEAGCVTLVKTGIMSPLNYGFMILGAIIGGCALMLWIPTLLVAGSIPFSYIFRSSYTFESYIRR